ncbi:MAG: GNAT family N-acetyltransferase [Crocinitomicaceae bacterium]|nr:GNAT family N-acetyltransferase [Crocinitomicaceae bacterium]
MENCLEVVALHVFQIKRRTIVNCSVCFKKEKRVEGIGAALMEKCLAFAKEAKYDLVYIETFGNMHEAIKLYERSGFEYIDHAIGSTGHFSCDKFLVKRL